MSVISELDGIIVLLESRLPSSLSNPQNEKLVRSLEVDMQAYFKGLDMAMDWNALEALYYRMVKE